MAAATYLINGVNIKTTYGVYISDSDGIIDRPKLKAPSSFNWSNYHGEVVDLNHKYYEPRKITLSCFIKAASKEDFIEKFMQFVKIFDNPGTQRLTISVHPTKPLIYEVYCQDTISIKKTWVESEMSGTFQLKLIEPEPIKKVLKHSRTNVNTKTCNIIIQTTKCVNIYWGDGSVSKDVYSENSASRFSHDYSTNGDYYVVITGCINEIYSLETNATVIWSEL